MILVYPMLTSGSVSPNVLPGLIKAVERYILIYNTDEVLRSAGATSAGNIISTGAERVGSRVGGAIGGAVGGAGGAAMGSRVGGAVGSHIVSSKDNTTIPGDQLSEKSGKPKGQNINITFKQSGGGGGTKPSLDLPRGDAISLEPTWLQVTTKKKGLQILGVKVVPFRIKSSESIMKLISQDKELKSLAYLQTKYGRGITRVFYRIMQRIKMPVLGDKALTGDPVGDILLGKTQYNSNMFLCMSRMDLENEDVFNQPGGIQKLHKLGWASFIIVDDVNRRTTFCMKEFGGVCSVVPYTFMFTSFSKDYNQAYEDLEDIKKASGPFFNMRTNRKKTFTESSISSTDKYLDLIQEK